MAMPTRLPRLFGVAMALVALVVLVVGFAPSFRPSADGMTLMRPVVMAHATLFSSWMVLFLVQTTLVATHRVQMHRTLGVLGACLAGVMVVSGPPMALGMARRGQPADDPLLFMLVIVTDVLLFGGFVAAGIYFRRRAETHRRLMLIAMIVMLPPAISRWPVAVRHPAPVVMGVMTLLLAAAPVWDLLSRRRPHPVSLWGGLGALASIPLRFAIGQTAWWHDVARWLVG